MMKPIGNAMWLDLIFSADDCGFYGEVCNCDGVTVYTTELHDTHRKVREDAEQWLDHAPQETK